MADQFLLATAPLWSGQAADAAHILTNIDGKFASCLALVLDVTTASFSGTIDLQGRSRTGAYKNLTWVELDDEGATGRNPSNDQISFTTNTAERRFLVPLTLPDVRIVMTRSAGNISGTVFGYASPVQVTSGALNVGITGTPAVTISGTPTVSVSGVPDIEGNVAHDGVDSGNPVKTGGKAVTAFPAAVANADRVDAHFDEYGHQYVKLAQAEDYLTALVNATASGNTQVVAAVTGERIRVVGLIVSNRGTADVSINFQSATTAVSATWMLAANGGGIAVTTAQGWLFQTSVTEALNINLSATGTVGCSVIYSEE